MADTVNSGSSLSRQDEYSCEQVMEILKAGFFTQGQYMLDVGRDGKMKVSVVKRRWVQKEDLQT